MRALTFCLTCFPILPLQKYDLIADLSSFWRNAFLSTEITAGYLPCTPSWRPFPSPFWIFVEGPEDIWSRVCSPHVLEPPAAFSRELPGVGTNTLHLRTRRSWKAAEWWAPISSSGTFKICLGSCFVASGLSTDGSLWVRALFIERLQQMERNGGEVWHLLPAMRLVHVLCVAGCQPARGKEPKVPLESRGMIFLWPHGSPCVWRGLLTLRQSWVCCGRGNWGFLTWRKGG